MNQGTDQARSELLPVSDALALMLEGVVPLGLDSVPLWDASGRVLAKPLMAKRTQPPFPASAMDGYAVRHADLATHSTLIVIGDAAAGHPFDGQIRSGQAVRIFTGAVVPEGADTIVIQEDTQRTDDQLKVKTSVDKGAYVRPSGLDFSSGERLLTAGTILSAAEIGLAAAANHAVLSVYRKPRVGILATGDELLAPGSELSAGQIIASNSFAIAAVVQSHGGTAIDLGIARDDATDLRNRMNASIQQDCDILVTLGGASVGDHDLVMPALKSIGMAADFWKIAMRPGKPLMTGRIDEMRVLGLPGNPVSSIVCAHIFLIPLLNAMTGRDTTTTLLKRPLAHHLAANGPRQHYMRAITDAQGRVSVFENQDSSILSVLSRADCLVVRAPFDSELRADDLVSIMPIKQQIV